MITLGQTVRGLLESTGAPVWYFYPQSGGRLPSVSWRERGSREFAQADGREHLAELEYTVDVWSRSPAEIAQLAERIDALMSSVRLRRAWSADLFDGASGLHHRSLRYRCVADAAGNVYQ